VTDPHPKKSRHRPGRRIAGVVRNLPVLRTVIGRMPLRSRPALFFETLSNVGTGAYITLFSISLVVLETVLDGEPWHLVLMSMMFLGSSLFSPLVTYAGRSIPMRYLVTVPNLLVAVMLLVVATTWHDPFVFALLVGSSFVIRVFPRVAEMNMFRVLYPATHRGMAVGWTKSVSALSGFGVALISWRLASFPGWYPGLYTLVAAMLFSSVFFYSRIPMPRGCFFFRDDDLSPVHAFRQGVKVILRDRRFMLYQLGFAIAGIANHMSLPLIPIVVNGIEPDRGTNFLIVTVVPVALTIATSPLWGRYLDKRDPMFGRGIFNALQAVAYGFYTLGGVTGQLWPFVVGTVLHAASAGGSVINWLTGSMYFARTEHVSLYNAVHVAFTGVRGLIGPAVGLWLFVNQETIGQWQITGWNLGPRVFVVSAVLSVIGLAIMMAMHATDTGPREQSD
jgi:hypothetical protein